ncbi:TatD family hydrolase [Pedobacter sp. SYSU D00535]|uniref:TatD family hydrolase n=1 Tax=Pedobacter sp. SYSU D00535 TaxID=2810308 RepID=UPI001A96AD49|nr:TatD family hydrolase [Pedobacter sp. SYSU D00535]
MVLTDTHTHLYYESDPEKRKLLMDRCLSGDITRLFLPNVDVESIGKIADLVHAYPDNCFPMLGLHPCDVKEGFREELAVIKSASKDLQIVAVGEIGIDLYWDKSTLPYQVEAFKEQIAWAKELNLPIVIHCRDAFDEVYEVLVSEKGEDLRGIFHCFTGTLEQAQKIIALGFYLGIGGVVTYKNAGLDKVVAQLSLENIVLETDAPYLTPVPFRGKPNESSYITYIANKVAELKGMSLQEVADITTQNSKNIFKV